MTTAILKPGEKVHIILRRRFEKDVRRHFAGEVEVYESGVARASGYVFVIDDLSKHLFVKRPDKRTKVFPLTDGELIINVLPPSVDVEKVHYELKARSLIVTDGSWQMDVKEFGWG
jgi:hypothetical protein